MQVAGRQFLFMIVVTFLHVACMPDVGYSDLVNAGDVAFIGFNIDGNDDFSIVLLADAGVGNVVHFNDNEWAGASFNGTSEGEISWTVTSALSAGTVVTFSSVRTAPTASSGTMSGGTMSLGSGEAIYAFTGTNATTPTTFLAALSTDEQVYNGTFGTLAGTGLTEGSTAVLIARNGTDPANGGAYSGSRSSEASFAEYVNLSNSNRIGNTAANWSVNYSTGTGFVPFDSTAFTLAQAAPEPSTLGMMAIASVAGLTLSSRRRSPVKACRPRDRRLRKMGELTESCHFRDLRG
ncbi:MAG: PEP-CTERM sorting domain-containing protein [Planctomycetaceae bacterium]|nr:PEP-CTERM sorting domain-containing protein [Planctomycetaceae bacterium]